MQEAYCLENINLSKLNKDKSRERNNHFSFSFLFSISRYVAIPLALLILSNDAAPGIGALEKYNYDWPTIKLYLLVELRQYVPLFLEDKVQMSGMMTAICANNESGENHKRYMASVVSGVAIMVFGIFAWQFVPLISSLQNAFVMMLVLPY